MLEVWPGASELLVLHCADLHCFRGSMYVHLFLPSKPCPAWNGSLPVLVSHCLQLPRSLAEQFRRSVSYTGIPAAQPTPGQVELLDPI